MNSFVETFWKPGKEFVRLNGVTRHCVGMTFLIIFYLIKSTQLSAGRVVISYCSNESVGSW